MYFGQSILNTLSKVIFPSLFKAVFAITVCNLAVINERMQREEQIKTLTVSVASQPPIDSELSRSCSC